MPLIDCDIHFGFAAMDDLVDYLDPANRDLVLHSGTFGFELPSYIYTHPTGWIRKDTYTEEEAPSSSLERLREKLLDPYDLTYGILIPEWIMSASILPNLYLAAALTSAHNDFMRERWLEEDARLRGSLVVPAQFPEAATREIRRLGRRDDVVQIALPGGARIPYGNPFYDPIWQAAQETGLAVAIHTHYEGAGIAGPVTAAGYPDFYVEYHTLCGVSLMGHLISILCHGVLERFPGVKVVIMEGGLAWVPGLVWRLDTNWKSCRSEIPSCKRRPSEYLFESIRFTTQPLEDPEDDDLLWQALAWLRPDELLLYASDYPHWDFDDPTHTLRRVPAPWRDAVAYRNAQELHGLPLPAPVA